MAIVAQNYHITMKECKIPSLYQKYDIYSVEEPQSQIDVVEINYLTSIPSLH